MSYHPEEMKGWIEGEVCPYCNSNRIVFGDNPKDEFGISAFFIESDGYCEDCGKEFKIVELVETTVYGTFKE